MTDPPAQAFMEMMDTVTQMLETVAGYKAQCEAQGFSPTAAEVMAMELHQGFIQAMFKGAQK